MLHFQIVRHDFPAEMHCLSKPDVPLYYRGEKWHFAFLFVLTRMRKLATSISSHTNWCSPLHLIKPDFMEKTVIIPFPALFFR